MITRDPSNPAGRDTEMNLHQNQIPKNLTSLFPAFPSFSTGCADPQRVICSFVALG